MSIRNMYFSITFLLFLGFSIWAYAPTLNSFFDPQTFVTFLNPLKAQTPYLQFLYNGWSWQNAQGGQIGFFRPLSSTLYMLEYSLFGFSPATYKWVSFLLHLFCSWFTGRTVFTLSGKKWIAAGAAMLFAIHPGAVCAVSFIATRPDVIATLFSILAFRSVLLLGRKQSFSYTSLLPGLFTALSLGGKELGIANFITLPLMYFLWPSNKKNKKNTVFFVCSLAILATLYFAGRFWMFGDLGGYESRPDLVGSLRGVVSVVFHVSGAAFLGAPLRIAVIIFETTLIAFFLIQKKTQGLREFLVAFLVTGIYSFQSVLSFPEPHYVYSSAAFTTLFMVYFFSSLRLKMKKWVLPPALFLVLVISGLAVRRESVDFHVITVKHERVYRSLERIVADLEEINPETCLVYLSRGSEEGAEMKNVPLYMDYLYEGQCNFVITDDSSFGNGIPVLIWNGEGIDIVR
jgi:hypothetical protein